MGVLCQDRTRLSLLTAKWLLRKSRTVSRWCGVAPMILVTYRYPGQLDY